MTEDLGKMALLFTIYCPKCICMIKQCVHKKGIMGECKFINEYISGFQKNSDIGIINTNVYLNRKMRVIARYIGCRKMGFLSYTESLSAGVCVYT